MSDIDFTKGDLSIKPGEVLFVEGAEAQWAASVQNGRLEAFISPPAEPDGDHEKACFATGLKLFSVERDFLIGINDLFGSGAYSLSYRAAEETGVSLLPLKEPSKARASVLSKKEASALAVKSLSTLIEGARSALKGLEGLFNHLEALSESLSIYYWVLRENAATDYAPLCDFVAGARSWLTRGREEGLETYGDFNAEFMERWRVSASGTLEDQPPEIDEGRAEYYRHLRGLPQELAKYFFGFDSFITGYTLRDGSECLGQLLLNIKWLTAGIAASFNRLYNPQKDCIFLELEKEIPLLGNNRLQIQKLLRAMEYAIGEISDAAAVLETEYGCKPALDMAGLERLYHRTQLLVKARPDSSPLTGTGAGFRMVVPEELADSAVKILEYSGIAKERAKTFLDSLEAYRGQLDRFSTDTAFRGVKKALTDTFFEAFEAAAKRALTEGNPPRPVLMFLMFGYVDEKLLEQEHLISLYRLADRSGPSAQHGVYSPFQWMSAIYSMEKAPSVNDFGQDYFDVFREMKKNRRVSDKDKKEYDNNRDARLSFEIRNMLRTNQKLCYGQISTYVPILHSGIITSNLESCVVTPERIKESLSRILEVDYSAFHREVSYRNQTYKIEKEYVMKAVLPDVILMPTFGTRASMWQEISVRNRRLPGRFIFPLFTAENLDDLMLKVVGNFRWELCRTMMGAGWNDITQKSLTSEYTDYIQFYKKNSELHEEVKERIKAQVQKRRGMMRDIFTSDYEYWINYEAKGQMRLNKVSRSILYRYCPFSRAIRSQLEKQPVFAEAATQFNILRAKQARELESRYNRYVRSGIPLDEEMTENLRFYKEL